MDLVGKPRAVIAGLALMALLGIGAVAAIVVDQAATSLAGAQAVLATPPARPVEATPAETQVATAPANTETAPADTQTAGEEPARTEPAKAAAARPEVAATAPEISPPAAPQPTPALAPVSTDLYSGLARDNPRWGRSLAETPPELVTGATQKDDQAMAFADGQAPPATAALSRFAGDGEATSGIPENLAPHAIPIPTTRPAEAEDNNPTVAGRSARVRSAVNLRSRPADEASVITVVPANSKVSLLGCKSWCEIEFENRRGFVYKKFVR